MTLLQKQFKQFEENIRLSNIDDNQPLRDKRDLLIEELREWGKKNDKPSFDWFNQGSYHMSTGIKPQENDDHDIDVAIVYDLDIKDYKEMRFKISGEPFPMGLKQVRYFGCFWERSV